MATMGLGLFLTGPALAQDASAPTVPVDGTDALAQDDEEGGDDDDLDDILGSEDDETVAEEREAVEEGRIDGTPGVRGESALDLEEDARREKRTIKVLQKKNFLKIGKIEVGPHLGFVTNDPFLNRYLLGGNAAYHVTEVLAFELTGTFSPDFGDGDWKPIVTQLEENNNVLPDISKMLWNATVTAQFSPIYGKIAVLGGNIIVFDFYGMFGFGLAGTTDDTEALGCDGGETDPCQITANQVHATSTLGGGFRVAFSKRFATRIEGRTISYIETLDGTSLEMKNLFTLQASATFFFDTGN